jgi:hypothetical protein
MLILILPLSSFGQSIQKTLTASPQACPGDKSIVAAIFKVSEAGTEPIIEQTACADAPVSITRMQINPDGEVWILFKNLDKERQVSAVGYLVTVFEKQNRRLKDTGLWARTLRKPVLPNSEMEVDTNEPLEQLKKLTPGRYLVQFSSILLPNMSEWQMHVHCKLPRKGGSMICEQFDR